jgi:hypothetical protein
MIPEKVLVCSSLIELLRRTIDDGYQGKSFRGREIVFWILLLRYALMLRVADRKKFGFSPVLGPKGPPGPKSDRRTESLHVRCQYCISTYPITTAAYYYYYCYVLLATS